MNIEHSINFEAVYQTLVDLAFEQNCKFEADREHQIGNYDTLYSGNDVNYNLSDGRNLKIRWVRIPIFSHLNKPMYHTVFLINTEWWEAKNARSIAGACKDLLQHRSTDSHTIFLCGRQRQFRYARDDARLRKHNIVIFNTNHNDVDDVRQRIFLRLEKFYRKRCIKLWTSITKMTRKYIYYSSSAGAYREGKRKLHIYGMLKKDWQRVNAMANNLLGLARRFWKIRYQKIRLRRKQLKQQKETVAKKELFNISKTYSKTRKLKKKKQRKKIKKTFLERKVKQIIIRPA